MSPNFVVSWCGDGPAWVGQGSEMMGANYSADRKSMRGMTTGRCTITILASSGTALKLKQRK